MINAPTRLDTLTQQMIDLTTRITPAEQTLAQLKNQFAETALVSVADNIDEARQRLTFAEQNIDTARDLGLGEATGIDLPAEATGRIPGRAWKREWWESTKDASCREAKRGHPEIADRTRRAYLTALAEENCESGYQFRPGDEANLSIGQGDVTATLLQMARVYGTIATDGDEPSPHLGRATVAPDGTRSRIDVADGREVELPKGAGALLRTALGDVVSAPGGTAHSAFVGFPLRQWPVAGKTGTAEFGTTGAAHAWFTGFAPADDPQIAVAVFIRNGGGTGGEQSAPIAADVISAYLDAQGGG